MENETGFLQRWFKSQCDGDWEHQYGVVIDTLDNPGWSVRIDLLGTDLEDIEIERVVRDLWDDEKWIDLHIRNHQFQVATGPELLVEALQIFAEIANEPAQLRSIISKHQLAPVTDHGDDVPQELDRGRS